MGGVEIMVTFLVSTNRLCVKRIALRSIQSATKRISRISVYMIVIFSGSLPYRLC